MIIPLTQSSMPLRDVLYALSIDERNIGPEVLDEFVRKYPEHAEALTDFAIQVAIDNLRADSVRHTHIASDTPKVSPSVSRAMSRFHNRLHSANRAVSDSAKRSATDSSVVNPFASLDRKAFRAVADGLNSNTVFVAKLRDRQIEPSTISQGFMRLLARLLNSSFDVVVAHCCAPMSSSIGPQFLKADRKPEAVSRQTFTDAVRGSGLTEDQQQYLLTL